LGQESVMPLNLADPTLDFILIAIVLIVVLGVAAYFQWRRKNTLKLRQRFGSEYERAVVEHGSERKAEARLAARETRVEKLRIRDLGAAQRERFVADWRSVESRFLDHPKGAVTEADELVSALLQARGYPVSGFEQSAEDVSVNYPRMMEYYRSAHAVAVRPGKAEASTEELRSAMIDYRTLFDELVQVQTPAEERVAS
jgi:hypothetical protein